MKRILFLIVSCSLFLTSCASTQDIVPADYKLPEFKEIQLDNGLRILFLEDPEIPFLSLGLSIPKGYIYDPVGKSGLSQIAVAMLRKGTKQRNATQIAEDLDYLGLDFSSAIDLELSTFSINGLSKFEGEILNNYKEMKNFKTSGLGSSQWPRLEAIPLNELENYIKNYAQKAY